MTAKKETTKTAAQKAREEKKAQAQAQTSGHGSTPIVVLPEGTGTQNEPMSASNPPPIERGAGDRDEKEPRGEDTLRLPEDKARWEYGETTDTATLLKEQRDIDAQQK